MQESAGVWCHGGEVQGCAGGVGGGSRWGSCAHGGVVEKHEGP